MVQLLLAVIYLSFISLGLPDPLLGSAWPTMYPQFGVPISYAGIISMTISVCTIISSLLSDRLTRRFGAGRITAVSVACTAAALLGFSCSRSFWLLLVIAIPYGLGAGGVDAALNNYVAVHYASRHMSWLHCMWGIGASIGPYIMSFALTSQRGWRTGYRYVSVIQIVLTALLFLSIPLWKNRKTSDEENGIQSKPMSIPQVLAIPGAKPLILAFFCYCALEQTAILWGSSYLVFHNGVSAEAAAGFASLFLIGLTAGRAANGFLTFRLNDVQLIRMGLGIITAGIVIQLLPLGYTASLAGLIVIGLGCAPIYPCIIHSTPIYFGADRSQAIIGIQMAAAYTGSLSMAPLFGLIAQHSSLSLFPWFLLIFLILMILSHETLVKTCKPH